MLHFNDVFTFDFLFLKKLYGSNVMLVYVKQMYAVAV